MFMKSKDLIGALLNNYQEFHHLNGKYPKFNIFENVPLTFLEPNSVMQFDNNYKVI